MHPRHTSRHLLAIAVAHAGLALVDCGGARSSPVTTAAPAVHAPHGAGADADAAPRASGAVAARGPCPDGMVEVPAGSFEMGSRPGFCGGDEQPQHVVHLSAYCVDRTEVTVRAYRACVVAGRCRAETSLRWAPEDPAYEQFWSRFCNWNQPTRDEHPMNCVDWYEADAFCRWRGARLPTEAEWEYAARGSDGRVFPWGDDAPGPTRLNSLGIEGSRFLDANGHGPFQPLYEGDDGWPTTAPVGSFPAGASPFGVLDMAGNVEEWVSDAFGPYAPGEVTNPTGPTAGERHTLRGGDWGPSTRVWLSAVARMPILPTMRNAGTGLRCAQGVR